jgi:hypothetical protein
MVVVVVEVVVCWIHLEAVLWLHVGLMEVGDGLDVCVGIVGRRSHGVEGDARGLSHDNGRGVVGH